MPRALVLALVLASSQGPARPRDEVPVLVELFTSEGCSSCPPADRLLAELLEAPPPGTRVIALGEHVDYWDELGWKDRFSRAAFTRRQEAYASALGEGTVFTPELVVGGRHSAVGGDLAAARRAIASAASEAEGHLELSLARQGEKGLAVVVRGAWAKGVPAEVFLALIRDHASSEVTGGENRGRTLAHVAVALSLEALGRGVGAFEGQTVLEGARPHGADRLVAFVEEPNGGPVHAVAALPLP